MTKRTALITLITGVTLVSGLLNLYSVINPPQPGHHLPHGLLRALFPLEFFHFPRSFTLLIGFALTVSAVNIYRRKRRAFRIVLALSCLSALLSVVRWHDPRQTFFSLSLVGLLVALRHGFTVKSRRPDLRAGLTRLAVVSGVAFGYGVAGFWLLEPREFGVNFDWASSIHRTLLYLALVGDPTLAPQTRHAAWFLDSLFLMSALVVIYAVAALFRPILYRFRTLPQERAAARQILERHGRSALDYFKLWPDKSYFFSASQDCFVAYRVDANTAVALGDPVGPPEQVGRAIGEFREYCEGNGWSLAWHQTLPDFLPLYRRAGFRKLKIGDDAIVDLTAFSLEGRRMRRFRQRVGQLEKAGVRWRQYPAPLPDELIPRLQEVSDEWLRLPGKRERAFTLGRFMPDYLRTTPVVTAEDAGGRILAFVNLIASYHAGEAAIDLMRHRWQAPNGVMDYLFIKVFLICREQGFTRFNLGMAPMDGFREREEAAASERAVHTFFQHLNFLFSFSGLKQYKAKFADSWEPRYMVYRSVLDLPKLGLALSRVTEIDARELRLSQAEQTVRAAFAETAAAAESVAPPTALPAPGSRPTQGGASLSYRCTLGEVPRPAAAGPIRRRDGWPLFNYMARRKQAPLS